MDVKTLNFVEVDNEAKLVRCLDHDKEALRTIPHQPGEFSDAEAYHGQICNPDKYGDYYNYYKDTYQLPTFEKNITTSFTHIKLKQYTKKYVTIIKPKLSIWPHYNLCHENKFSNIIKIDKAIMFLLKENRRWGPFLNHTLPYIYFAKELLDRDNTINILIKKPLFDSFEYIIRDILNIQNPIIYVMNDQNFEVDKLYHFEIVGPFASGLFPYQAYCNVPLILYKNINKYIRSIFTNYTDRDILIYTKRNTKDTQNRKIINEHKIIEILKKYCLENKLEYVEFEYYNYTPKERFELFNKAKIVVGPHGSANHHVFFCNKETKIIEFIFVKNCHNDATFSLAFDLDYWQIPVKNHGQYDNLISIDEECLESLVKILYEN